MDYRYVGPKKIEISEQNREEYEKITDVALLPGMLIFLDENSKLHRTDGPAVVHVDFYRTCCYYLHGTFIGSGDRVMPFDFDAYKKTHKIEKETTEKTLDIKGAVSNMITLVTDKLFKSSQKYGTSSYVLNDMTREIQEEIVDICGWSLMESIRLMEALKGKIYHADEIYWTNFLKKQDTSFLEALNGRVSNELTVRKFGEFTKEKEKYAKEFLWLDSVYIEIAKGGLISSVESSDIMHRLTEKFNHSATLASKILDLYSRSKEGFYAGQS